jgi:hypothetical protein
LDELVFRKFHALINIADTIEEINSMSLSDDDVIEAKNIQDNPYYQKSDSFSPNVMVAKVLKENITVINEIYNYIKDNRMDIPLQTETRITTEQFLSRSIEDDASFIDATVRHFRNHLQYQLGDERNSIDDTAFNANYRKSIWVLSVIYKFVELNDIKIIRSKELYEKTKTAINKNLDRLEPGYQRDESKRSLNTLALSLIYFIRELYGLIYVETQSGLEENTSYKAFKMRRSLLRQIKATMKLILDRKRIADLDWNFDIEEYGLKVLEHVIQITVSEGSKSKDM